MHLISTTASTGRIGVVSDFEPPPQLISTLETARSRHIFIVKPQEGNYLIPWVFAQSSIGKAINKEILKEPNQSLHGFLIPLEVFVFLDRT